MLMVEEFEMWDQDGQGACGRQGGGHGGWDPDVGEQGEEEWKDNGHWASKNFAHQASAGCKKLAANKTTKSVLPPVTLLNVDLLLEQKSVGIWIYRWFRSSPPNIYLFATSWKTELNIAHHSTNPKNVSDNTSENEYIILKCPKDMFEINKALTRTKFLE